MSVCCIKHGIAAYVFATAVADLSLELATTNYLGPALPWTLIRHDVSRAIAIASPTSPTITASTSSPPGSIFVDHT